MSNVQNILHKNLIVKQNYITVPEFLIHTKDCNGITLYLISLDLHKTSRDYLLDLVDGDLRFVEIGALEISIHASVFKSIHYKAYYGRGYKLPRIIDCKPNE